MEGFYDLVNEVSNLADESETWLTGDVIIQLSMVLLAAFGIAVGFVAYKLIKRALNKA